MTRPPAFAACLGGATVILLGGFAMAQPLPSPSATSSAPPGSVRAPASAAPSASSSAAPVPLPTAAEILVLHAHNGGTGIDPKIAHLKALSRPPFSAYNSYDLVNKVIAPLVVNSSAKTVLPNGSSLAVTLNGVVPGQNNRFTYSASITKATGQSLLSVQVSTEVNNHFYIVGEKYTHNNRPGTLVVAIKL